MELDPRRCIFPVFIHRGTERADGAFEAQDLEFIGSGFFVRGSKSIAFVTARHVVDRTLQTGERLGIVNLADGSRHMWDDFEFHPSADLAVARFPADKVPPFVDALPVYFNKLNRGNGVSSFGFPFSGAREVRGQQLGITVEEIFFKGHVATIYDRDQLESVIPRAFRVSYGLSFESPMGLSGAPLLALVDGVFHVVGIVYENRTVEFQVDEYHEEDGENGKQRPVLVKRVHNIGLAGAAIDLTDLVAFAGVND